MPYTTTTHHQPSYTAGNTVRKRVCSSCYAVERMLRAVSGHVNAAAVLVRPVHGCNRQAFANTSRKLCNAVRQAEHALLDKAAYTLCVGPLERMPFVYGMPNNTHPCNTNSKILRTVAHNHALVWLVKELSYTGTQSIEQADWITEEICRSKHFVDLVDELVAVVHCYTVYQIRIVDAHILCCQGIESNWCLL